MYSFQFKFLSTFFNLMRGTLEWNENCIKWLFDLLLRMVHVQGFGQDHEAVLINNYVRVGGGTIFYWRRGCAWWLQNSLSFKDASGGMAYLTQMSLMKKTKYCIYINSFF